VTASLLVGFNEIANVVSNFLIFFYAQSIILFFVCLRTYEGREAINTLRLQVYLLQLCYIWVKLRIGLRIFQRSGNAPIVDYAVLVDGGGAEEGQPRPGGKGGAPQEPDVRTGKRDGSDQAAFDS
jgi:hypothetical protein